MPFERVLKDASDIQKVYYVIKNKYLKAYTSEASKQTPQILIKATGYTTKDYTVHPIKPHTTISSIYNNKMVIASQVCTITKWSLKPIKNGI